MHDDGHEVRNLIKAIDNSTAGGVGEMLVFCLPIMMIGEGKAVIMVKNILF